MESANEPITVIITRQVRPGSEAAFEDAIQKFAPKSVGFPGHLGVHMLRPPQGGHEYEAVLKFHSQADWAAFQSGEEYLRFLADIRPLLAAEPAVESLCGLESWFTPVSWSVTRVPPRWKMAIVTWVGVCVTVDVVSLLMGQVAAGWPWAAGFLVANALVVAALTWAVMPAVS